MLGNRTSLILALAAAIQLLSGCSGPSPGANNANSANEANANRAVEPGMEGARDNADELRTLIRLPYEPEDLVWKEYAADKQRRRLLAVLQFTTEDTRKLVEASSRIRPGTPATVPTEKWFPKELVTQSEMSGEEGVQATSYAADEFFQQPFSEGTLSRVNNTDFFVLELFASQNP
jgi:hypothetical protein